MLCRRAVVGLLLIPNASLDRTSFPAISRTRMAASFSMSRMESRRPKVASSPPCSSWESQMLAIMRRRFRRTAALLWWSFCLSLVNRSARTKVDATWGLNLRSFCRGSRVFSNALALESCKHSTTASVNVFAPKIPSKRCSSTLAVSSCSLW